MDPFELLISRRSIRKFTGQAVDANDIENILKAAMYAPSAGNQQPWHFIVLTDKALLTSITEFHPHARMLPTAEYAILVCGDTSLETKKGYWMLDCSAATQNILLASHALGLGAVWLGIYPRQERMDGIRNVLSIPESIIPFSLVAIGHPAETKPIAQDRFKTDRIHFYKW